MAKSSSPSWKLFADEYDHVMKMVKDVGKIRENEALVDELSVWSENHIWWMKRALEFRKSRNLWRAACIGVIVGHLGATIIRVLS